MNLLSPKYLLFTCILITSACNKQTEVTPDNGSSGPETLLTTAVANTTGTVQTVNITATGATAIVNGTSASISIPAGAMAAGAKLSLQATNDPLDNEGAGFTIEGSWTKPITISYRYNPDEQGTYNVGVQLGSAWVRALNPKYDVAKGIMTVRLSANTTTSGAKQNAKVAAKKYSLVFAKDFYLKPESQSVEIGKSVTFTAYTKQGFIPVKYNNEIYDTEAALNFVKLNDKLIAELDAEDAIAAFNKKYPEEADLVPLSRDKKPTDDDEVVPLPVFAKEYQFSNKKTGFNRNWNISGVGTISNEGKYTAPNEESAKGNAVDVQFTSTHTKTNRSIVAKGKVYINDGVERYMGTFNFTTLYEENDPSLAYPTKKITTLTKEVGKLTIKKEPNGDYVIDMTKPKEASIEFYSLTKDHTASTGSYDRRSYTLTTPTSANWGAYDATRRTLIFEKNNTYQIRFSIPTSGGKLSQIFQTDKGENKETVDYSSNTYFSTSKTAGNDNIKIDELDRLAGEKTWTNEIKETSSGKVIAVTTNTAKWSFLKVK